jgi:hypothetical protein
VLGNGRPAKQVTALDQRESRPGGPVYRLLATPGGYRPLATPAWLCEPRRSLHVMIGKDLRHPWRRILPDHDRVRAWSGPWRWRQADGIARQPQRLLDAGDRQAAEVEHAGGQHGVGAGLHRGGEMR